MRKYSGVEDKLYINGLCVSGERLKLSIPPKRCYTNKNIKIGAEEEVVAHEEHRIVVSRNIPNHSRKTIKVNVAECEKLKVCNKQLRRIYETVEIRDFERILNDLYTSNAFKNQGKYTNKEDKVLKQINAEEVYEEFFGQYCNYLNDVITSKSREPTSPFL